MAAPPASTKRMMTPRDCTTSEALHTTAESGSDCLGGRDIVGAAVAP